MIGDALVFLRDDLNDFLKRVAGTQQGDSADLIHKVAFVSSTKTDSIVFEPNCVAMMLINIEQENTVRSPDPRIRPMPDGSLQRTQPDVMLNLHVLFVANFVEYQRALDYLSLTIQHFQSRPVFNRENAPALKDGIEKLLVELVTLPFSEQNEIWNALRRPYQPSVLYKVKMIVFRDEETLPLPPVQDPTLRVSP